MNKILLIITMLVLTACSNELQINSDSENFMGEKLGKLVSDKGELFYDEDKGCFLKTKTGAIANCLLKTKTVFKISVNCENSNPDASIDGIKCGSSIQNEKKSNFKKLCNESRFDDGYYLKKNNAYFWINSKNKVDKLVLTNEENHLRDEGEDLYTNKNCQDIPRNREETRLKEEILKVERLKRESALKFWENNVNWNFLVNACTTTNDQLLKNCDIEYAVNRNVIQTTFETYQENSITTHIIFGREYRDKIPVRFQKDNFIFNAPVEYKKLLEPNHIEVHMVGNGSNGKCHNISEFFLDQDKLYEKVITQYGDCTEMQKILFESSKGVTEEKRLIKN